MNSSDDSVTGVDVLICSFLMVVTLLLSYITKRFHVVFLPESAVAMLLGMLFGALSKCFNMGLEFSFSPNVFFYGLLPIIIFNAGYALKKKDFFRNFSSIILFAVVGTIISSLVYGLGTYYLYTAGYIHGMTSDSPLLESLMFGSLISAIDPVATLSIFQDLNAPALLYNLVFGESLVNDASSIVLFRTFESFSDEDFSMSSIGIAILWFCAISVGSILLGFVISLLFSLILKHMMTRSEYSKFELAFVLLSGYISYSVAELMELSGIMSLFFCGICNSHYGYHNTAHATKISSKYAFEALAFMAELFVFAYLGMQVIILNHQWDSVMVISSIPLCLLSRALNIFPLSWLANLTRSKKIPNNMKMMMWISGLRGAIAYALAVNMPTENHFIETTTLFVVVTTTLILGSTTGTMLETLGLLSDSAMPQESQDSIYIHLIGSNDSIRDPWGAPSGVHRWFKWFDHTYLKPIFGGHVYPTSDSHLLGEINSVFEKSGMKYFGDGFQLCVPSDWKEVISDEDQQGMLVKFISEKCDEKGKPVAEVCVMLFSAERDDMEDFGNPMTFLLENWDKIAAEGILSNGISNNSSNKLYETTSSLSLSNRQPIALIRSISFGSDSALEGAEPIGQLTSPSRSSAILPSHNSIRNSSGRVELINSSDVSLDLRNHSRRYDRSSSIHGDSKRDNMNSRNTSKSRAPAFVMWVESMRDEEDRVYFRYEIVVHGENISLQNSEARHLLLSSSGIVGSVLICRVQAMESWFYEEGAPICKAILNSFRVVDEQINVDY